MRKAMPTGGGGDYGGAGITTGVNVKNGLRTKYSSSDESTLSIEQAAAI